jgi:hypothetical protein
MDSHRQRTTWFVHESVRRSFLLGAEVFCIFVVVVSLEVISAHQNWRFDLTPTKQYSLAPISQKILRNLDQEIQLSVFYVRGERKKHDDLLSLMVQETPLFRYHLFDLDRTPGRAEQYGITSYGMGVVETKSGRIVISKVDQEEVVRAILRISRPFKTLYFVSGHGERELYDKMARTSYGFLKTVLAAENYHVHPLALRRVAQVPQNADLVVVAGPREDFLPQELELLSAYVSAGGKVMFLLDPDTVPELCRYLARFGFGLDDGVVIDKQARLAGGDPLMPTIPNFVEEIFPRELWAPVVMPVVRPVRVQNDVQDGQAQAFAFSSSDSWAQHKDERMQQGDLSYRAGEDTPGPVPVAAVATIPGSAETPGKIVVFGDSDFVTNFHSRILGNLDFFMSTLGWLLDRQDLVSVGRAVEGLVQGRSSGQSLYLSEAQSRQFFWFIVVLEPGFVFLVGTLVFLARRRRG